MKTAAAEAAGQVPSSPAKQAKAAETSSLPVKDASEDNPHPTSTSPASTTKNTIRLAVFFSTGDLGDVGRHVVTAALERRADEISSIKVFCKNTQQMLLQAKWNCVCPDHKLPKTKVASSSATSTDPNKKNIDLPLPPRLTLVDFDITTDDIAAHLPQADVVIACLGNRKPFHPDCIARAGTHRIVQAILEQQQQQQKHSLTTSTSSSPPRFLLLSSAGIANDWPPMEWCQEGQRLESLFRTICWSQYQDLTGAEQSVTSAATAAASDAVGVEEDHKTNKEPMVMTASKQPEAHHTKSDTNNQKNVQQQQQQQQQRSSSLFDYLIVRVVLLEETCQPAGRWQVQRHKYTDEHPHHEISKLDCARFLVQEAVCPAWRNCAVLVGGSYGEERVVATGNVASAATAVLEPKPASITGNDDHDEKQASFTASP